MFTLVVEGGNMKKRKLKGYVLPSIYGLVVICIFATIYFLNSSLTYKAPTVKVPEEKVMEEVKNENDMVVVNPVPDKPIKPFNKENIEETKSFYKPDDSEEIQQKSLIYYENTYMQNTGILYTSEESFEILASVDGTIKEVKDDEILGTVVIIEHNTKVVTTYYSLSDVKVKAGDMVKVGDIIGTSGTNKLENINPNCLLFEVYINGNLVNPNEFYETSLEDLK